MTAPGDVTRLDPFAHDAGPYVLGALSPEDAAAFEAHLAACPVCQTAVDEVSSLPALLSRVPSDLVNGLHAPRDRADAGADGAHSQEGPSPLLTGLLRAARQERRTRAARRWAGGAVGAAAVVVLTLVLSGGLGRGASQPAPPTADAVVLEAVVDSPVQASVELVAVAWGTRVTVSCRYDSAETRYRGADPVYSLVVRDAAGRTEEVATWSAVPGKDLTVPAATVMPREDIVEVEMRDADGSTVLRART